MPTAELIIQARAENPIAQKQLYDLLAPRAKMKCLRYVTNNEDAEDCMIVGMYKFLKNLGSIRLEDEKEIYAYFKTTISRVCIKFLEKKKRINHLPLEEETAFALIENETLEKMECSEIFYLITQLSDGYRTVFNLYAVEGYEHKDIAGMLRIKDVASRSSFSRARQQLQKMLTFKKKTNATILSK